MLKYQINILMVFKVFSQYCINISKYQYNIEKKNFEYHQNTLKILSLQYVVMFAVKAG